MLHSWYQQLGERVTNWFKIAPNLQLFVEELTGLSNQENLRKNLLLPIYKTCWIHGKYYSVFSCDLWILLESYDHWTEHLMVVIHSSLWVVGWRQRYEVKQRCETMKGKEKSCAQNQDNFASTLSFQSHSSCVPIWKELLKNNLLSNITLFRFSNY